MPIAHLAIISFLLFLGVHMFSLVMLGSVMVPRRVYLAGDISTNSAGVSVPFRVKKTRDWASPSFHMPEKN